MKQTLLLLAVSIAAFVLTGNVMAQETRALTFDVSDGKFYADGSIYTGQSDKWEFQKDGSSNILILKGFNWETSAPIALEIQNDILLVRTAPGSSNSFVSTTDGIGNNGSYGIYAQKNLIIEGEGTLIGISGRPAAGNTAGVGINGTASSNITLNSGTLIAKGGIPAPGFNPSYGLYTQGWSRSITMTGGTLESEGLTHAMFANSFSFPASSTYWVNDEARAEGEYTYGLTHSYVKIQTGGPVEEPETTTLELTVTEGPTVRVRNTGDVTTGKITAVLSGVNVDAFYLTVTEFQELAAGNSIDITVGTKPDLAVGTYTAIITFRGSNFTSVNTLLTYKVKPATAPEIETELIETLTVQIRNVGNGASDEIKFALSGTDADAFVLPTTTMDALAAGASKNFIIDRKPNLATGTYTANLSISGANFATINLVLSFEVISPVGIEDVEGTPVLKANVTGGGTLHVAGLTHGEGWRVYSINGMLVHAATANSDEARISLPQRGVYVIVTNKKTKKIVW